MAKSPPNPALKAFCDDVDTAMAKLMPLLHAAQDDWDRARLVTGIKMSIALRLVTFALGPAARNQQLVTDTAMDILSMLQELEEDHRHANHQ